MPTAAAVPDRPGAQLPVFLLDLQARHPETLSRDRGEDREWMEPLLQQNAVWFCRLRWIVITVLAAAGVAGLFPGCLNALGLVIAPAWPLALALVLASLN